MAGFGRPRKLATSGPKLPLLAKLVLRQAAAESLGSRVPRQTRMQFISFIAKNVLRRKVRSALTGVGVAVAIAAVVALLGVSRGFEESSRSMLKDRGVDIIVVRAGLGQQATARIDEAIGQKIAELPEVNKVAPVLIDR